MYRRKLSAVIGRIFEKFRLFKKTNSSCIVRRTIHRTYVLSNNSDEAEQSINPNARWRVLANSSSTAVLTLINVCSEYQANWNSRTTLTNSMVRWSVMRPRSSHSRRRRRRRRVSFNEECDFTRSYWKKSTTQRGGEKMWRNEVNIGYLPELRRH